MWLIEAPIILINAVFILPLIVTTLELVGISKECSTILSFLSQQLALIIGTIYLKNKYPLFPKESIVFKPDWPRFWKSLLWLPAILLLSLVGTSISTQVLAPLFGPDKIQSLLAKESSRINLMFFDSWRFLISFIFVCIIGPFSEEVFFRGFFLSRMSATYSPKVAYFITSIFFALPHFYLINFFPIFLLSLMLCYIARHEGLWGAIGAHIFFNTLVFINMVLNS